MAPDKLKNKGISTLEPKKIWFDDSVKRLNDEGHGKLLGHFSAEDKILVVSSLGFYELMTYDLSNHFPENVIILNKFHNNIITCLYFNPTNKLFYIKRFIPKLNNRKNYFIPKETGFYLKRAFIGDNHIRLNFYKNKTGKERSSLDIIPSKFINIKGFEAIGKQLSQHKIKSIDIIANNINPEEITDFNSNESDLDGADRQITMDFN